MKYWWGNPQQLVGIAFLTLLMEKCFKIQSIDWYFDDNKYKQIKNNNPLTIYAKCVD